MSARTTLSVYGKRDKLEYDLTLKELLTNYILCDWVKVKYVIFLIEYETQTDSFVNGPVYIHIIICIIYI